jgi:hypothetical protein
MGIEIDFVLAAALKAVVFTQPITEISTRDFSWGVKAASAYG